MNAVGHQIGSYVENVVTSILHVLAFIPGSKIIGQYILKSHQNDPARTVFEVLLALFALRYFLASKQSQDSKYHVHLSSREVDELCKEWIPEPLVDKLPDQVLESEIPVIQGSNGPKVHVEGYNGEMINFSSTDVYDWSHNQDIKQVAIKTIRKYGVGPCGPAGFYGNQAAHIETERVLAKFLDAEAAIIYAQGLATATSVVPCFAKRSDILVVDSRVNMSLQKGVQLSRAKVLWFKHNDMEDLERKLQEAVRVKHRGLLPRRIIITEGLFEYTGDSPDLNKIIELKNRYKFRLILDETWSLGALGPTGRGITEEQNIKRSEIDITVGSLASLMGSSGGFCAASAHLVEHQRIVSLAYTFSASCPAYLCEDLISQCRIMGDPSWSKLQLQPLLKKSEAFYHALSSCKEIELISRPDIPIVIFKIRAEEPSSEQSLNAQSKAIGAIVMQARQKHLLVSRLRQIARYEVYPYVHAIRLYIPNAVSETELLDAAHTLKSVIESVCN